MRAVTTGGFYASRREDNSRAAVHTSMPALGIASDDNP